MRDASYLMIYEGPSKISSQPVITFPSDQLTALEATVVKNDIVVLAGTADGKVKKVNDRMTREERKEKELMDIFFRLVFNR